VISHDLKDTIETFVTFGSALAFLWGFVKFAAKLSAMKDVPEKVDNLGNKVDNLDKKVDNLGDKLEEVDRKVENLDGQFDVFKTFGMGRK